MTKKKITIDLIMVNICNKRCDYCCIKFNGGILHIQDIDYIIDYLDKHKDAYESCTINFFWWEPLLNYKWIVHFIEKNKNPKISYTIWTNWLLLNKEKLDFLKKHDVKMYLSFHADRENSYVRLLEKSYLKEYKNIEINLIVSPINLQECYQKIDKVIAFWFKKINIIPIMLTIKWTIESLKELSAFIAYVDTTYWDNWSYPDIMISKFSFFDWIIQEKTFVIDYNLDIYQDSSDELYIWKQFDQLGKEISDEIQKKTLLGNIKSDTINLSDIIEKHSVKEIFRLIYKLPKKMWYVKDYYLIYMIMNKNEQKLKRWSYMIFWSNT